VPNDSPVLLALEAERRGFAPPRYKHPLLAFRRFLRRAGVEIIETAGQELVVPAEIDAAVRRARAPAPANDAPSAVALALVASITGGR
jgi:hypothetical protein